MFVEARGHPRMPFLGNRTNHRAGIELTQSTAHRAAEAVADLERRRDDDVTRQARRDRFEIGDFAGRGPAGHSVPPRSVWAKILYSIRTNGPGRPAYCVTKCAKSRRTTMKVLLTGGSGNLGHILVPKLLDKGDTPVIMDIRAPRDLKKGALFIEESILDRPKLTQTFRGCDCIVHIAGWHGIHEDRGEKNAYDFFDLNVRGTFEVCEAAASAGIDKVIFISTTSVYRPDTLYAQQDPGRINCRGLKKAQAYERGHPSPPGFYSTLGRRHALGAIEARFGYHWRVRYPARDQDVNGHSSAVEVLRHNRAERLECCLGRSVSRRSTSCRGWS
jgi:hypothetical protein